MPHCAASMPQMPLTRQSGSGLCDADTCMSSQGMSARTSATLAHLPKEWMLAHKAVNPFHRMAACAQVGVKFPAIDQLPFNSHQQCLRLHQTMATASLASCCFGFFHEWVMRPRQQEVVRHRTWSGGLKKPSQPCTKPRHCFRSCLYLSHATDTTARPLASSERCSLG